MEMPEAEIRKINPHAIVLDGFMYDERKCEAAFKFAEQIFDFKIRIKLATLDFNSQHDVLNEISKKLHLFDDISSLYKRETLTVNLGQGAFDGNKDLNADNTETLCEQIKGNIEKIFAKYDLTLEKDISDILLERFKEILTKKDLSDINPDQEISMIFKTKAGKDRQIQL